MERPVGTPVFLEPGPRAPRRIVTSLDDVEAVDMTTAYGDDTEKGGHFWSLVSRYTNGASEYDFGVYKVAPDTYHARHWHPDAAELYFVTEGRGFILLADGEEAEAVPGKAFYFPAGTVHGLRTEDESLTLVYCFSCSDYRLAGRVWVE